MRWWFVALLLLACCRQRPLDLDVSFNEPLLVGSLYVNCNRAMIRPVRLEGETKATRRLVLECDLINVDEQQFISAVAPSKVSQPRVREIGKQPLRVLGQRSLDVTTTLMSPIAGIFLPPRTRHRLAVVSAPPRSMQSRISWTITLRFAPDSSKERQPVKTIVVTADPNEIIPGGPILAPAMNEKTLLALLRRRVDRLRAAATISDVSQPLTNRMLGLRLFVEHGYAHDAWDALSSSPDLLRIADQICPANVAQRRAFGICRYIVNSHGTAVVTPRVRSARDFLFKALEGLWPRAPKLRTRIREELLTWIFKGINLDLPLSKQNQSTLHAQGGLFLTRAKGADLRLLGSEVVAKLLRLVEQGVALERAGGALREIKSGLVRRSFVRALDGLSRNTAFRIDANYLKLLGSLKSRVAMALLSRLATDEARIPDGSLRELALVQAKGLGGHLKTAVPLPTDIKTLAATKGAQSRLSFANDLLRRHGPSALEPVLNEVSREPIKRPVAVAGELTCLAVTIARMGDAGRGALSRILTSKDIGLRMLSVIGHAFHGDTLSVVALKTLSADATTLEWFIGSTTLGRVARMQLRNLTAYRWINTLASTYQLSADQTTRLWLLIDELPGAPSPSLWRDRAFRVLHELRRLQGQREQAKLKPIPLPDPWILAKKLARPAH